MNVTANYYAHETALVESDAIGKGTQVWAFAHIMDGAEIGKDCKIGDHTFIESGAKIGDRVTLKNGCLLWYGVQIEDDVFIGPNVVFTNVVAPRARYQTTADDWLRTEVGQGATVGANATILPGIRLGRNALIGAGSVVTAEVPDHAMVLGNPGAQRGWVCECGCTLDRELICPQCNTRYVMNESGLTQSEA